MDFLKRHGERLWWGVFSAIAVAWVLSTVATWANQLRLVRQLDRVEERLYKDPMARLRSTWISGGIERQVETTRLDSGETDAEHVARHEAAVEAALKKYPKDL